MACAQVGPDPKRVVLIEPGEMFAFEVKKNFGWCSIYCELRTIRSGRIIQINVGCRYQALIKYFSFSKPPDKSFEYSCGSVCERTNILESRLPAKRIGTAFFDRSLEKVLDVSESENFTKKRPTITIRIVIHDSLLSWQFASL